MGNKATLDKNSSKSQSLKPSESEKIIFWKPNVNPSMEADDDRPEAVEATTVVPGTDSVDISRSEVEERVRRRNKWNGMKLAAEAEGDVDEDDDDPDEDEVRLCNPLLKVCPIT